MGDSGIGSVYSPPSTDERAAKGSAEPVRHVETVIDIGYREQVRFHRRYQNQRLIKGG